MSKPAVIRPHSKSRPVAIPPSRWHPLVEEAEEREAIRGESIDTERRLEEWPLPIPITGMSAVKQFKPEFLPSSFRDWVADIADRMQVPIDYPAVVAVLALAGAVNRRAWIQPKQKDTQWLVVPNLWGAIVGPPGFLKSPVMKAMIAPLQDIQRKWWEEFHEAESTFEQDKEKYDMRRQAWKELYKADTKKNKTGKGWMEEPPTKPTLRRVIVNDTTYEAVHQTMSGNGAGILLLRDELDGWWSQLDKAGREGERAFYKEGWNGDTCFDVDRIGRGSTHVPAVCISMMGNLTPSRLRSYLSDALTDAPGNDGLIQRFQLLIWPDTVTEWKYVDRKPDPALRRNVDRVFSHLVEMDAENPRMFKFDAEAQAMFVEWLTSLEISLRGDQLHPALTSHLSKYRSLLPSLALLFELADGPRADLVSAKHVRQAIAWCDYLKSHSERVYSCVVTPELRAMRELAEKIRTRKVGKNSGGLFSPRDVYTKDWSGLTNTETVKRAARLLVELDWLKDVSPPPDPEKGGRPKEIYAINPRVYHL